MAEKKPVEVTYGDLVNGDTIVDKSGSEWAVLEPAHQDGTTAFRLADPKTPTIPVHTLTKPATDPVTVLRVHVETQAEEVERREAETPDPWTPADVAPTTTEEAVEAVAEALGGETVAEETAAEADARKTAGATGEPVAMPLFSAMSMLERKSHLYLLHGVFAHDVKTMSALDELHTEAEEKAPAFPHVHTADAKVEVS